MDIEQLQVIVKPAIADSKLSKQKGEVIKTAIYSDRQVTPEEAQVFRELQEKVWSGAF